MINPDQLRSLMNNEKILFAGLERDFEGISSDERVMDLFLEAVDKLYDSALPQEIADISAGLKDRISQFSLSHDYLDVSSHANETVYKITLLERRIRDEADAAPEAESGLAEAPRVAVAAAATALRYLDVPKAESVKSFLDKERTFEEFYAYCQINYPSFINDVLLCSEIFKKFPKDLALIVPQEVALAASEIAYSGLEIDQSTLNYIQKFPFTVVKSFLIKSLFTPGLDYGSLDKKNCLMQIAFHAVCQDPALKAKVKEFSEFHFQSIKDGKVVLEFIMLAKALAESEDVEKDKKGDCLVKCLDLTPINPLLKKAEKGEVKKEQFTKSLKKVKVMTASLRLLGKEDLRSIAEKSDEEISAGLVGPLFDKLGVDRALEHDVIEQFCSSRYPMGLFQYTAPMEDEAVMPACKTFIEEVASGRFKDYRHEHNTHKTYLTPEQLAKWECGGTKALASGKAMIDSEEWQDLFLCGTEVQSSCQAVNGDTDKNKCLMGYCLDGKCRVICIKDEASVDQPIISRAIIRIVLDESNSPCLYLDDSYPFDDHELIETFAKERADEIGLPLYVHGRDNKLFSKGCAAPYEYADATAEGVQDGPYEFKGKLYSA